ncbi:MAG: hypothetical protein NTZ05_17830, partial [Chloroflexi bacterium]|nr:hypothetical protein [Chloroflexota bacterium]
MYGHLLPTDDTYPHSRIMLTALLFLPVELALLAAWPLLSEPALNGVSVCYLLAATALALAVYLAILNRERQEAGRSEQQRPWLLAAEQLCRVGKLAPWDNALWIGLILTAGLLAALAPFTASEALLPGVTLLAVGIGQNRRISFVENPARERRNTTLAAHTLQRSAEILQATSTAAPDTLLTLRFGEPRDTALLQQAQRALLDLRWTYQPPGGFRTAMACEAQVLVNLDHYRAAQQRRGELGRGDPRGYFHQLVNGPDGELRALAEEVERLAVRAGFNRRDVAGMALALTQQLGDVTLEDADGPADRARSPLETLVEGEGAGDSRAVLAAALL